MTDLPHHDPTAHRYLKALAVLEKLRAVEAELRRARELIRTLKQRQDQQLASAEASATATHAIAIAKARGFVSGERSQ